MAKNIESLNKMMQAGPSALQPEEIREWVANRLEKYKSMNTLEGFAMFMGMAQVLELRLKQLFSAQTNSDLEDSEKWTMGKTITALAKNNLRPDLIELLRSVCEYRNYIAHEYLANVVMLHDLLGGNIGRLEQKYFDQAVYKLEQVTVLFDWCEENHAW